MPVAEEFSLLPTIQIPHAGITEPARPLFSQNVFLNVHGGRGVVLLRTFRIIEHETYLWTIVIIATGFLIFLSLINIFRLRFPFLFLCIIFLFLVRVISGCSKLCITTVKLDKKNYNNKWENKSQ